MAAMFREKGHIVIDDNSPADACIINTCTVTATGAQKSRQQIRRAIKQNPNAIIAVTGCFSQTEPEKVRNIEGVDIIIGNKYRNKIVEMVEKNLHIDKVENIRNEHTYEELTCAISQNRVRANIKIEDGCDNFCTYCIIPYARGPVRSRELSAILKEGKALANAGFLEVVLTGIHLDSYGKDLDTDTKLIDVLEALDKTDGIERIRLGSLEPVLITDEFADRAKKLKKLCPQFHLALQSGCDDTLKRMNRHYTTADFKRATELLKRTFSDAAFTTDLMVGFPGETEDDFKASYDFCAEIGFSQMHVFPYSVRKGTRAAEMPNQLAKSVKEERAKKMIALGNRLKSEFYGRYIGRTEKVLIEKKHKGNLYHGTTANYMDILVPCKDADVGSIIDVTCAEYQDGYLIGK